MLKPFPRRLVLYPMALDLSPFTVSENLHLRDQLQELARKKQVIQLVRLKPDLTFRAIGNAEQLIVGIEDEHADFGFVIHVLGDDQPVSGISACCLDRVLASGVAG